MMEREDAFDGVFMNAVERCQGINNFFERMFGFFKRKTDLFDDEAYARQVIDQAFKKNLREYM